MIRTHLVKSLYEKLLGPEGGPEEVIEQPYTKYQMGILESCFHSKNPRETIDASDEKNTSDKRMTAEILASVDNDVQWPETEIDMGGSFTLGASFVLKGNSPKIRICTTWGRYEAAENLPPKMAFQRKPNYYLTEWLDVASYTEEKKPIRLVSGNKNVVTNHGAELWIRSIRNSDRDDRWTVQVFLVNRTEYRDRDENGKPQRQREPDRIFQPQIRIKCKDSEVGFLGDNSDEESLLYYKGRTKARGFQCSAIWGEVDPEGKKDENEFRSFTWPDASSGLIPDDVVKEFTCPDIRTEYLPVYSILQPEQSPRQYDADFFADTWDSEEIKNNSEMGLNRLVTSYKKWISEQEELLKNPEIPDTLRSEGSNALKECKESCAQIEEGIDFISNDERARLAFCFMNSVMSDKRKYDNRDKTDEDKKLNWREFQMAFILQSLRGVAGLDKKKQDPADVLWFPTGGGKTEAYLGITIFAASYRRLLSESEVTDSDGEHLNNDGGVCVISRYTLRLLTIQQFQRALGALVVSDIKRIQNWIPKSIKTDSLKFEREDLNEKFLSGNMWGNSRFSIGMWIGGDATPTRFALQKGEKGKALLNAEGMLMSSKKRQETTRGWEDQQAQKGDPAQVRNCPVCGNVLCLPPSDINFERARMTWIISTSKSVDSLRKIPAQDFEGQTIKLNDAPVFSEISDHDGGRFVRVTMDIKILMSRRIDNLRNSIDSWWNDFVNKNFVSGDQESLCSTRASMPGYFFLQREGENSPYDFVIHCTNADCELNKNDWSEKTEANRVSSIPKPFRKTGSPNISTSVPISAYTIDEQVYARCPTFIISTSDKFANLPWDPRCASLFGNIDCVHTNFGYGRRACFRNYKTSNTPILEKKHNTRKIPEESELHDVRRFLPPSLIIQDELHLIEGPLGSMVGVYEMAVDILCRNNGIGPKYIASSATIKEAGTQVGTIFRKEIRTFPRRGIFARDNFFAGVEEDSSCTKENAGRLYLGICSSKSTYELPIKASAIIMSEIHRIRENPELYGISKNGLDKEIDPYWTYVSYFTDLQLMSRFTNFYADDIQRDVKQFSPHRTTTPSIIGVAKFPKGTRLFPIKSDVDMDVWGASVYCDSYRGSIAIALYDDNTPTGNCLWKSKPQKCSKGQNPFLSKDKICNVTKDKTVWLAIINSDENSFHLVDSSESFYELLKNPEQDEFGFPSNLGDTKESTGDFIRMELTGRGRSLDSKDMIEMSSETKSVDLPKYLDRLQKPLEVDALLTSPVFGTGIDVPRLGLMNVMNQPKTTSGYIQSTGRVGREDPGLVITWLRARRARDLSHYENFVGYHRRIHDFVEPVTANPFSDESLQLGLGPIIVSILRNARKVSSVLIDNQWINDPAGTLRILTHKNGNSNEVNAVTQILGEISKSSTIPPFRINSRFQQITDIQIKRWLDLASDMQRIGEPLIFGERNPVKPVESHVILGTLFHESRGLSTAFPNTRSSMRDTESAAMFYVQQNKISIRPSQFMTRYGPGSLLPGNSCSITAPSVADMHANLNTPIGNFEEVVDGKQKLKKIEINDSRMTKMLHQINDEEWNYEDIHIFAMPTNDSLNSRKNRIAAFDQIYKSRIFPEWGICSQHRGDRILAKIVHEPNTNALAVRCPRCQNEKNPGGYVRTFANVRFVLACSNGHMSDIGWGYEIHRNGKCNSTIQNDSKDRVFHWAEAGGGDDITFRCYGTWQEGNKFVETTCNAETTYTSIKGFSNIDAIPCNGEFVENEGNLEPCKEPAKFVRKSQMSLRSPINRSSLVIRQRKSNLFEKLHRDYSGIYVGFILDFEDAKKEWTPDDLAKDFEKGKERGTIRIGDALIRDIRNTPKEELQDVKKELHTYLKTANAGKLQLTEQQNLSDELSSLEHGISDVPDVQHRETANSPVSIKFPVRWTSELSGLGFEAMPYSDIKVTNVQTGYTREVGVSDNSTTEDDKTLQTRTGKIVSKFNRFVDKSNNNLWYMGNQNIGEGIFIHLQPEDGNGNLISSDAMFDPTDTDYKSWNEFHEKISGVVKGKLESKGLKQHQRDNLESVVRRTDPLFVWWHSFAHQIITELAIDSGFTTTALNERIYCMENDDGTRSAGILIYVATPGSDGTLGGLTSLVDKEIIPKIVGNAERHMLTCSNDPVCAESKFNKQKHCGASCHCCLQSPETSCEYMNKFLDRNLFRRTLQ